MKNPLEFRAKLFLESLEQEKQTLAASGTRPRPLEPLRTNAGVPHLRDAEVGDVWCVEGASSEDLPALVTLTWVGASGVRGILTTEDTWLASSEDIVVPADASPTQEPLLLCTWREAPLARPSLVSWVGSLPQHLVEALAMVLQNRLTPRFTKHALGPVRAEPGEVRLSWSIEPAGDSEHRCEFHTGAPIISQTDPRLAVRMALVDCTAYFERDALGGLQALEDPLPDALLNSSFLIDMASRLHIAAQKFFDTVLASSEPETYAALAASSQLPLTARWRAPASAHVSFILEQDGTGTIKGRFGKPAVVRVGVFDASSRRLIQIGFAGEPPADELLLAARTGARRAYLQLPPNTDRTSLCLVVRRADA